ncbi:hypothetical protein [Kordiimonas sp.]|uniref:hypothetical protein n=1 Tax=Kordiimonas sp. TaxID=1970157 RepID=UPI003A92BFCC
MRCLTDIPHRAGLKLVSLTTVLLLLGACATGGTGRSVRPQSASVQRASDAVEQAMCEGRAIDAARMLMSEPLSSAPDRFYTGLALEQSGRPVAARRVYASLMNSGSRDMVFMRCGNEIMADGMVGSEAGRRLAIIASELQTMDVARMQPVRLDHGLPAMTEKPADVARTAPAAGNTGPRRDVTRPSGSSPLGRWFAHLASYRSYEQAVSSKSILEKKYPALSGIIDQWEVNVGGFALRLGVRLQEKSDAQTMCNQVKSQGDYCAVLDTSQ